MVDLSTFIQPAMLALALGALIGIERERSTAGTVGLRSFALLSFFGFLASYIAAAASFPLLEAIGFLGALGFSAAFYNSRARGNGLVGITTVLSLPLTYLLGALLARGFVLEAVTSAIAIGLLLAERKRVHAAVKTITHQEIVDGLIFAVIAFVIYPMMPLTPQTLLGYSFDLQLVWKIVVAASLLSYSAHLLAKYLHGKGVVLVTFLGGAVSSLGVMHLYSSKVKNKAMLGFAFVTSSAGAYAADLALLVFIAPSLMFSTGAALAVSTVVLVAFAFLQRGTAKRGLAFDRPLSLSFVVEFTLLFLSIELLSSYGIAYFGQEGLLVTSFLGGLASSTAVFASVASMFTAGSVSAYSAGLAILLGLAGSFAVKIAVIYYRSKGVVFTELLKPALFSLVAGAVAFILLSPS